MASSPFPRAEATRAGGSNPDDRSPTPLPEGIRLRNQYTIGPVLGAGGFGITYRARDDWLDTPVAIKEHYPRHLAGRADESLSLELHDTEEADELEFGLHQFLEEGRTLARFDHPNIVGVRSFFEGHGTAYLVMDYYEGESLDAYLAGNGGRLPEADAISLLRDALDGLQSVHAEGVLHRDIDPGNVYRTAEGQAVLLDFGAARAAVNDRAQSLSIVFKPGYAPPEQYRDGGEQGPWTDVYACAATLYECLTGLRPPEATQRLERDTLAPPHDVSADVSLEVGLAVMKGLALAPERRPESAASFSSLLTEALGGASSPDPEPADSSPTAKQSTSTVEGTAADADSVFPGRSRSTPDTEEAPPTATSDASGSSASASSASAPDASGPDAPDPVPTTEAPSRPDRGAPDASPAPSWRGSMLAGGLVLVLLAAAWWATGGLDERAAPPTRQSVAVLPFHISNAGPAKWKEGMATVLSTGLDGTAGLRAVDDRTVFATWADTPPRTGGGTERSLRVARRIGAQYAVVGAAVALGSELRFSVDVHDVASGRELGSVQVQGAPDRLMDLADQLTRKVLEVLLAQDADASVDIAKFTTRSLPALKSLLAGERHFRDGRYEAAVEDFRDAARRDSSFALAYARLGASLDWLGYHQDATQARERAVRLGDRLTRRERWMVEIEHMVKEERQFMGAVDTLRRMVEAYPDDAKVWYTRGEVFFHSPIPPGWPAAERSLERATTLAPGVVPYQRHLVALSFALHRDRALVDERLAAFPEGPQKRLYSLAREIVFGAEARRQQAVARLDTMTVEGRGLQQFTPLTNALKHPADVPHLYDALQALADREDTGPAVRRRLPVVRFRQGNVDAALEQLRTDRTGRAARLLAREFSIGTPLPDSLLRARLAPSTLGASPSLARLHGSGLYLAQTGSAAAFERVLGRIQDRDSLDQRRRAIVTELKGMRAWADGDLDRAEALLGESNASRGWGALWRGDLYRELGRPDRAAAWYTAAWAHPVAHERLGQVYQQQGRPEKAEAAHRRFIKAWMHADPSLRPRVRQARSAIRGLVSAAAPR